MRLHIALAAALATFGALAANSPVPPGNQAAVSAGTEAGRAILSSFSTATYDDAGGRDGAGQVTLGGQRVDLGDVSPGTTREEIQRARARRVSSAQDQQAMEQEAQEHFNETARKEDSEGEAVRAMLDTSGATGKGQMQSMEWLQGSMAVRDGLSSAFADCKPTTEVSEGAPIPATLYTETSCVQVPPTALGETCQRYYEFEIEKVDVPEDEESDPDSPEPSCNTVAEKLDPAQCPGYRLKSTVVTMECEAEAATAQCEVEWICTNAGPLVIDGEVVPQSVLEAQGIGPVAPGHGMPPACLAAVPKFNCPVCLTSDDGSETTCTMVDPTEREPTTCQEPNPLGNPACQPTGKECLLTDRETGRCILETVRYSCGTPTTIPTKRISMGNTCDAQIQCIDGSCAGNAGLGQGETMTMQEAMARMAVQEMMATDMSYDAEALANGDGSGELTPAQQKALDEVQMFKGTANFCQKGYAGLVDCCGETRTNAEELYWSIYQRVMRDRQAAEMLAREGSAASSRQQWADGKADYASLSNPFTSLRENVTGGRNVSVDAVTMTIWEEFLQRARAEIKPGLSPRWVCKDEEFDLAIQREVDMCSYAGTYCSKRVLGACLKRKEAYCCYNSPMSKALRASAEPGGVLNHGSAKSPDCRGLRIEELDRINWEAIDFTRLVGKMDEGRVFERTQDPANAAANYTGSGQTGAMGGAGRQTVQERSQERLDSFDPGATRKGIAEDVQERNWLRRQPVEPGPARLSFATGNQMGYAGRPVLVTVKRMGSEGSASATVRLVGGSPEVAGFWQETVYWGLDDTRPRSVTLMPPEGVAGDVTLELQAHQGTVEGNGTIIVRIR